MANFFSEIGRGLATVGALAFYVARRTAYLTMLMFALALPLLLLFLFAQVFLALQINYRPIAVAVNTTLEYVIGRSGASHPHIPT